jgi:hypothetical protein
VSLAWDGSGYVRSEEAVPGPPIAPGWWVVSASQRFEGLPRRGIVVAVVESVDRSTGEVCPTYVCVEDFQGRIWRLDVPEPDVAEAHPARLADLAWMRRRVHWLLGDRRRERMVHASDAWLELDVVPCLRGVEERDRGFSYVRNA